ncbi:MAG: hypothetical protein HRU11_09610 [Parvularculaceae bacterium]|nr:hypothetical protein [Parvularculaceae bacterium]
MTEEDRSQCVGVIGAFGAVAIVEAFISPPWWVFAILSFGVFAWALLRITAAAFAKRKAR